MEPSLFTQQPDTMLGRMFSGEDYCQVEEIIFNLYLNTTFVLR